MFRKLQCLKLQQKHIAPWSDPICSLSIQWSGYCRNVMSTIIEGLHPCFLLTHVLKVTIWLVGHGGVWAQVSS